VELYADRRRRRYRADQQEADRSYGRVLQDANPIGERQHKLERTPDRLATQPARCLPGTGYRLARGCGSADQLLDPKCDSKLQLGGRVAITLAPKDVGDLVPQKHDLLIAAPDGGLSVYITPASFREDLMRGQYLQDNRYMATSEGGVARSVHVNQYGLKAEEIWITYHHADFSCTEIQDGKEVEVQPFKPRDEMTKSGFMRTLARLPTDVVLEWNSKVLEVNPDWQYPF
jgi:hypothetical protein